MNQYILIHQTTANIYLFKVNNGNTRRYEICSINKDTKMTACYYHVTYLFKSESTPYCCLNMKELFARNRRHISSLSDCNGIRTYNHLVRKRTVNHLTKLDVVMLSSLVTEQISDLNFAFLLLTLDRQILTTG